MAYDKKLLAAARRELERERTAHTEELEARRRDIYTREPRIRAIDRELSTTAASVLRAAMESGGDPTAAIEKLRDRNLGLQEERGNLLRQLGLPADYLAGATLKTGDTAKIQWEPSDQFFGNPSLLKSFIGALGSMYRKKVKSTVLEDYDIWQFSNDIDKHIFKPM